jgi:histone deacetylase complex regulatory component SIN3
MALEMSHQTPAIPPNTLTESSDDQATSYVYQIKLRFVDSPDIYDAFLRVLKDYRCQA